MGASQQSVEWKLKHEEKYLKKIKEENKIKKYNLFFISINFNFWSI
jgi:hypothetical protein